MPAEANNSI